MSISLYRKYRPQTFADVIGQKHIVQTLSNAITHDRVSHAYLFTGPRGTGKTTMARIFARAVNCLNPKDANPCLECEVCKNITDGKSLDIFEIDAASNTGVDNIRELRENVKFPPTQAKFKVYIIDEVHMLSTGAFNALLKTLEEPPAHVIFILATTEIHKVPETIISRCQRFDFTRLPIDNIVEKLSLIAKSEKVTIDKEALEMIAIAAEGGMRDAESLFSQIIATNDKKITAKDVDNILGTTQRQSLEDLAGFILNKDATSAINLINQLTQEGYDLEVFNKSFLNFLRQLMLVSVDQKLSGIFSHELTKEQAQSLAKLTQGRKPQEILFVVQCFAEIQGKIRSAFIPQLPMEMAIVKAVGGPQVLTAQAPQVAKPLISTTLKPTAPQAPIQTSQASNPAPIKPVQNTAPVSSLEPKKITPETPQAAEIAPQEPQNFEPGNFTINDIKRHWNAAIDQIRPLNASLSAALPNCQPARVEGDTVVIAAKFSFYKDKLNEQANKLTIESVFAKILGSQLKVRFLTAQEAGVSFAENHSFLSSAPAEEKASETSSLLTDAINIMGGTVVE
ncbi:MAG TPA: DNA polymerase III subunit gamma/tau [Patescibacteria group bacterium]